MRRSLISFLLTLVLFSLFVGLSFTFSFAASSSSTTTTSKSSSTLGGIHPLYIQGHSPIDILVTDPNGHQIGCQAEPCSGNTPGVGHVVNTIGTCPPPPGVECATFSGAGTTPESVTIVNPIPGTYNVEVFSIGTGTFTLTSCVTASPNCSAQSITLCSACSTSSSPQLFAFELSSSGQLTQATTGVPQFPFLGMLSITAIGIALVVVMRGAFVPRRSLTNVTH